MENQQLDQNPQPKSKKWLWILVVIFILSIGVYLLLLMTRDYTKGPLDPGFSIGIPDEYLKENSSNKLFQTNQTNESPKPKKVVWQEQGVAVAGEYADAEVVKLDDGRYRLYYAVEPEVKGNNLEVYSSVSTDGKTWTKEEGARKTMATFPDVLKLTDGTWRLYFQNAGIIKSATSADGLTWKDEAGVRIDKTETGFNLENVGAQSTIQLADGSYLMVYRGLINEPYETSEQIPNKNTQIFFYAISTDGLTWTKKGLALDSRNDTLYGLADGAELVQWTDDEIRLYFWSYQGVYHLTYADGQFSTEPVFDFTNNKDSKAKFPPNPPGDPALIMINDTWFMFYGQHQKGIYFATLAE